jgi:glycosyltransferase involved in cell wall biosynthesis
LLRTLSSVLTQSVPFDEVIVVDDCSNDDSKWIVEDFNRAFKQKIKFFCLSTNFGGPAKSRNLALLHNTSYLISYLDADDLLLSDRCLSLKILFSSQPFDACVSRPHFFQINRKNNTIIVKGARHLTGASSFLTLTDLLDLSLLTPGSSLCFKSSVLSEYQFAEDVDIIAGEDREVLIRMAVDQRHILYSNKVDFLYNSGYVGEGLLASDLHITSATRSLRFLSYYHSKYRNIFTAEQYLYFDFSHMIALIRLHRYYEAVGFLFRFPASHILQLMLVFCRRIRMSLFSMFF